MACRAIITVVNGYIENTFSLEEKHYTMRNIQIFDIAMVRYLLGYIWMPETIWWGPHHCFSGRELCARTQSLRRRRMGDDAVFSNFSFWVIATIAEYHVAWFPHSPLCSGIRAPPDSGFSQFINRNRMQIDFTLTPSGSNL